MNKRQVIVLWIIAIALIGAVAAVKLTRSSAAASVTQRAPGQTLFEAFPADEVASIELTGAEHAVTLRKKDGAWTVVQRDDYPAEGGRAHELLRTLADLKVAQGIEAGPTFAPRFGMDPESSDPAQRGIAAVFKDAAGKELAAASFGKALESTAPATPMGGGATGRYVRNHADTSGFYAVSEPFHALTDDPGQWLKTAFITPQKIRSVAVSQPGKTDLDWKAVRADEAGNFALEGASANEALDSQVVSALTNLFSYARFQDIVPAAEAATRGQTDQKRTVTIATFDGFTYTLTLTPEASAEGEKALLTVEVAADLAGERAKPEGETEEAAKTADAEFQAHRETLQKKLADERALAGRTFLLSGHTVEPLLKGRDAILKKEDAGENAAQPGQPGAIEATTPPVMVPGFSE